MRGRALAALLGFCACDNPGTQASDSSFQLPAADLVRLRDFSLGKWMIAPDLSPAHWIGEVDGGRRFREPINVIFEDRVSATPEEAKRRLAAACAGAGFPARTGHSSGYKGWMDGRLYEQLPEKKDHAFSDEPFELGNNHGRVFGPLAKGGAHYFIASFSREKVAPASRIKHQYASFNRARDRFSQSLDRLGVYRLSAFESLGNALINDPALTTGDHDGVAVRLTAR
jgi:hypothetical protein